MWFTAKLETQILQHCCDNSAQEGLFIFMTIYPINPFGGGCVFETVFAIIPYSITFRLSRRACYELHAGTAHCHLKKMQTLGAADVFVTAQAARGLSFR